MLQLQNRSRALYGICQLKILRKKSLSINTSFYINTSIHFWVYIFSCRPATGWTVRESNPGGGKIFRTRPDRPWGPRSLLHNGYGVSFLGVKRPGRGVTHPPPSSTEVKEKVELYLYSPSGPSWPVLGFYLYIQLLTGANVHT